MREKLLKSNIKSNQQSKGISWVSRKCSTWLTFHLSFRDFYKLSETFSSCSFSWLTRERNQNSHLYRKQEENFSWHRWHLIISSKWTHNQSLAKSTVYLCRRALWLDNDLEEENGYKFMPCLVVSVTTWHCRCEYMSHKNINNFHMVDR